MSTILKSYDWSFVSQTNRRERKRSYPWDDWFDGRIHQLEPKTDFDGPPTSLERVIRTSANRRGIKVRIRIDAGNVIVQKHDGSGDPLPQVTKSPSKRSILEAREAAHSNGGAGKTRKRLVKTTKVAAASKAAPAKKKVVKRTAKV